MKITLFQRVLIVLAITLTMLGITAHLIHKYVLLPSFLTLERQNAEANVLRILNALENEIEHLDRFTNDWSAWDDTYQFVTDRNQDYITSNLVDETFAINQINLIVILDAAHRLVWSKAVDLETMKPLQLDGFTRTQFPADFPLLRNSGTTRSNGQEVAGLVMTGAGPMLCASRPILKSDDTGPSRGFFIMGRLLSNRMIAKLSRQTGIDFNVEPHREEAFPVPGKSRSELASTRWFFYEYTEEALEASTVLTDLEGEPMLDVTVVEARTILQHGRKALRIATLLFAGGILAALALMLLMLQRSVIAPIKQITRNILDIRRTGQSPSTVTVSACASPEVCLLADAFDTLMKSLDNKNAELANVNYDLLQEAKKLKEAEKALKNLDQLKSEFISTAAHELRTPVTTIMGYTELLADHDQHGPFSAEQRQDFLGEIYENCEGLTKIVDDILDVSRIEAGKRIPLQKEPAAIGVILAKIVKRFKIKTDNPLHLEVAPDCPVTLDVDTQRIGQVLENLLSNAIKYSPKNTPVVVRAVREGTQCKISVIDQGIGMTPEQVQHVFDKFYRADASDTAVRGLGLGMSIVRQIITDHGGTIWVESRPGKGTEVDFTLPVTAPSSPEESDEAAPDAT